MHIIVYHCGIPRASRLTGLRRGGAALILCTIEHRAAISAAMRSAEIELEELRRKKMLVWLDVRSVLERLRSSTRKPLRSKACGIPWRKDTTSIISALIGLHRPDLQKTRCSRSAPPIRTYCVRSRPAVCACLMMRGDWQPGTASAR